MLEDESIGSESLQCLEEAPRMEEPRDVLGKEPPKNMDVEITKGRGKGPAARAAALAVVPASKKQAQPKKTATRISRVFASIRGLTAQELKLIHRRRAQQVENAKRGSSQRL